MKVLLIAPDNGSYVSPFPLGLGYIAAVLRDNGHEVTIFNKDIYHYSAEYLTRYLDENQFDVVGSGTCGGYRQYREMKSIAAAVRKSINKTVFVLGGALVHPGTTIFSGFDESRFYCSWRRRRDNERTLSSLGNWWRCA